MTKEVSLISDDLRQALMAEDPLGKVLRAHLYIERAVNELINLALRYPEKAEKGGRLTFGHRIHLAAALGLLRRNLLPPLKKLNTLRNDLAHDLNAELAPKQVDELIKCLSARDKKVMTNSYERTCEKLEQEYPKGIEGLDAASKFALVAVVLYGSIINCQTEMQEVWPGSCFGE